jgi:hypothetical protein
VGFVRGPRLRGVLGFVAFGVDRVLLSREVDEGLGSGAFAHRELLISPSIGISTSGRWGTSGIAATSFR